MKLRALFFIAMVSISVLWSGCVSTERKMLKEATLIAGEEPTAEESSPFEQVGLVKLVNTHSSFVLIEARVFDLPPNLTLKSFEASAIPGPEAETAILKVSLERTGRFIVADIISGLPGKGDLVYR